MPFMVFATNGVMRGRFHARGLMRLGNRVQSSLDAAHLEAPAGFGDVGRYLMRFLDALSDTVLITAGGARLIVITACVAGLRVSEVLGLTPADIDSERETLRVERRWRRGDEADPKSEGSRRERQIDALAPVLLAYAQGKPKHAYIFTRPNGQPLDDRDLQRDVFRPAAEAIGIYHEGFGMHVFRRLNVTWRQQVGATPVEAQKAAGHTSLDMTMLYTQTEDQREREHVKKNPGETRHYQGR
jgi:integrase